MRAYSIPSPQEPGSLCDLPRPAAGAGEVLVRIHACGLNFADLLMMKGQYQDTPDFPLIPGMELAGTIEDAGAGTALAVGTRVAVFSGHGGLAGYGVFPETRCVVLRDSMSFEQAAGFQIAYGTSHVALDHKARLQPGETLLVLGASGGVGLTAVEIGKHMGARVIACARGSGKLDIARAAGADHVIDSETADLRAEVLALGGADVVYDPVGGEQFRAALRACNPEARMLVIGFASGEVPKIPANHLLVKNISVLGMYWGGYLSFAPQILTDSLETLFDWHARGLLSPHISHILPLEQAADAFDLLRQRKSTGKVVVSIKGSNKHR